MSETPKIVCNRSGRYSSLSRADFGRRSIAQCPVLRFSRKQDMSLPSRMSPSEVNTGETFVVMGLSGSGKSTLVRCISRLIEPTAGSMVIDGEDIMSFDTAQLTELRRFRMSMVFQHFGLFPHRKVIDNISFGLEIRGMDKKVRRKKHSRFWRRSALTVGRIIFLGSYQAECSSVSAWRERWRWIQRF